MLPNLGIFPDDALSHAAFERLKMRIQNGTVRIVFPSVDTRHTLAHTF
jgi:hypothetical protein